MSDESPTREEAKTTETYRVTSSATRRIGNYRLYQKIGEGGMGEVWEAEQEKPIRRKVALKIIRHGMDSRQVVARFEAERQALAMMNHPNVARVFDAGTTANGRPYFVMELVKGVPITEHCDVNKLTTDERLELFRRVCAGVQHAHKQGIIHRDIKPSNVLVQIEENDRVPKIIDFGVAKATQQRLTERTLFTEIGVLIGTPEYMSPEQAEMTAEDIDPRTDVYSLGVLLYELLVGALPFDPTDLRRAGFDEIRRKIREEEPSKPSTRIGTLGDCAKESARKRRTDPSSLQRLLRGDLDWVTMKALEKDRSRRFGSPMEFAEDIRRHLQDEPVVARPPGIAYRVSKFVRRNRTILGTLTLITIILALVAVLVDGSRNDRKRLDSRARNQTLAKPSSETERARRTTIATWYVRVLGEPFGTLSNEEAAFQINTWLIESLGEVPFVSVVPAGQTKMVLDDMNLEEGSLEMVTEAIRIGKIDYVLHGRVVNLEDTTELDFRLIAVEEGSDPKQTLKYVSNGSLASIKSRLTQIVGELTAQLPLEINLVKVTDNGIVILAAGHEDGIREQMEVAIVRRESGVIVASGYVVGTTATSTRVRIANLPDMINPEIDFARINRLPPT